MGLEYYVYLTSNLAATDHVVTAFFVTEPVNPIVLAPRAKATNPDAIGAILDDLEAKGVLHYEQEFIPVKTINKLGISKAARPFIESAISLLMLETNTKPDIIFRSCHCPATPYFKLHKTTPRVHPLLNVGAWIDWFKRKWWIDHLWHVQHPQFCWNENYALNCRDHALTVLEHGGTNNLFYRDFLLKSVPRYWLNEVRYYNPDYFFEVAYHGRPPVWWERASGVGDFTAFLTPKERYEAKLLQRSKKPSQQFKWFIRKYPPLPISCTSTNLTSELSTSDSQTT